jgi:hypothetical protein
MRGIKPAVSGTAIPSVNVPILRQNIGASLARGDYWFVSAVFHAADRPTLADWRDLAIYSSEVTVAVRQGPSKDIIGLFFSYPHAIIFT